MDKLGQRLRDDAEQIDLRVSAELQHRVEVSLRSVETQQSNSRAAPRRGAAFWWASSLTGLLAASAAMLFLNMNSTENRRLPDPLSRPLTEVATQLPPVELNVQPAMLTGPLEEELEALQADIEKVRQQVRDDIGL